MKRFIYRHDDCRVTSGMRNIISQIEHLLVLNLKNVYGIVEISIVVYGN